MHLSLVVEQTKNGLKIKIFFFKIWICFFKLWKKNCALDFSHVRNSMHNALSGVSNASSPLRCITKYIHFCLFNKVKVILFTHTISTSLQYTHSIFHNDFLRHIQLKFCVSLRILFKKMAQKMDFWPKMRIQLKFQQGAQSIQDAHCNDANMVYV